MPWIPNLTSGFLLLKSNAFPLYHATKLLSIRLATLKMQKHSVDSRGLINIGDGLLCLISKGKPLYYVSLSVGWGVGHMSRQWKEQGHTIIYSLPISYIETDFLN